MKKPSVKPVLLSGDQFAAICKIQDRERQRSDIGVAPSVHQIARGLVAKALASMAVEGNA
ncbi:hypothetical protein ND368_004563 [Escherichia coli]|nr:hypothetical protein [Escherichia coli]ELY7432923.1 hypothetical protein [Escherichia coli]MCL9616039.1 hypothetical protein [Salmonella enterica subsp. enterica serovar Enteritidis]MHS91240.1 hypothetical protein [Escherichia coli]